MRSPAAGLCLRNYSKIDFEMEWKLMKPKEIWDQPDKRGMLTLFSSALVSLAFFLFYIIPGIAQHSIWLCAVATAEITLFWMRFLLVSDIHRIRKSGVTDKAVRHASRKTALALIYFAFAVGGIAVLAMLQDDSFYYSKAGLIGITLLTLCRLVWAIRCFFVFHGQAAFPQPETDSIRLAAVCMSVFSLETAFVSHFSRSFGADSFLINVIFGSIAVGVIILLGLRLLWMRRKSFITPEEV